MAFKQKQNSLIGNSNKFLSEAIKTSYETVSEEGALKYNTSGNPFVDNFAAASHFKEPRSYDEVAKDMSNLWGLDPNYCVQLAIYLRLITRKSKIVTKDSVEILDMQRGQGLRNEGIMRMLWLALNHKTTFEANFPLYIAAGSWKDVIQMLSLDLQFHGWKNRKLNWSYFYTVLKAGLTNKETSQLVLKYLPTIRTNKKCTTLESQADTLIGRWFAHNTFKNTDKVLNYKLYRKLKANGLAHEWQQKISKQLYEEINFDSIAGRALMLLVDSNFLENHNLVEKYTKWITCKPVVKFTGFVFELFAPFDKTSNVSNYKEITINKQFAKLIEEQKCPSKLLVVRDTSGSMTSTAIGCNMSSYNIAKAMALYFSEFLDGTFKNHYVEFANKAVLKEWKGDTPCEKFKNDKGNAYGGTDFQSVIDLFIKLKDKGVPESDFPDGILCLSDGEFSTRETNKTSNFNRAIERLKEAGFSEDYVNSFKIILWDIPNLFYGITSVKFEDFADTPNFFYLSGYDPSAISFIFGGNKPEKKEPKNAEELFEAAMDQELLRRVKIYK